MKKLVFLSLFAVFVMSSVQTGFSQGCGGMRGGYRYYDARYLSSNRTLMGPSWRGMYYDEFYPRNYRNWGIPRWRGMYYDVLTSDQKEDFIVLERKYGKQILRLKNDVHAKHLELESLRLKDETDSKAIEKKFSEFTKAKDELEKILDEYRAEAGNILPRESAGYLTDWDNWRENWAGPNVYCPMWGSFDKLTTKEKDTLIDLERKFGKRIYKLERTVQIKRLELESLRLEEEPDSRAIEKKLAEVRKTENKLQQAYDAYQSEISNKLPEASSRYLADRDILRDISAGPGGYCPMLW